MTEIRTLSEGEKITEPGFYSIPLSVHHAQPCDGPSVTSGVLRTMELQTPADVWVTHLLNPDCIARTETDALRLGRVMAAYIERGNAGLDEWLVVLPSASRATVADMVDMALRGEEPKGKAPSKPDFDQIKRYVDGKPTPAGKASVEYWLKVEADPREKVTEKEFSTILRMAQALALDPSACAVMGGVPEVTMAWFCEESCLWVLSRPDTVSFDGAMSDYKRMSAQGGPFTHRLVDRRIEQHGYHQQMALAAEAFEMLTGDWPTSVGIVAQSDVPPHSVILREITEECLRIGQFQNRRARLRFRECLDSGDWPGPGSDVGAWQPSAYFWDRMQGEMQIGGAP